MIAVRIVGSYYKEPHKNDCVSGTPPNGGVPSGHEYNLSQLYQKGNINMNSAYIIYYILYLIFISWIEVTEKKDVMFDFYLVLHLCKHFSFLCFKFFVS